jgi:hypothetical protein
LPVTIADFLEAEILSSGTVRVRVRVSFEALDPLRLHPRSGTVRIRVRVSFPFRAPRLKRLQL